MRVDVLSVREAREQLPRLLERFRGGDRSPVFLGSHRKTEAVMIPIQVYEELTQRRLNAAADATASVRAEGLEPSTRSEIIIDQWVHGQISAEEMERQIAALHGLSL
jgi:Antitoxin VbhA